MATLEGVQQEGRVQEGSEGRTFARRRSSHEIGHESGQGQGDRGDASSGGSDGCRAQNSREILINGGGIRLTAEAVSPQCYPPRCDRSAAPCGEAPDQSIDLVLRSASPKALASGTSKGTVYSTARLTHSTIAAGRSEPLRHPRPYRH